MTSHAALLRQKQQLRAFSGWLNLLLADTDMTVSAETLPQDLRNGVVLAYVVGKLLGKSLNASMKPRNKFQEIETLQSALHAIEKATKMPLINIDATTIRQGSVKLVLGLVWQIVLKFQVEQASQSTTNCSVEAGASPAPMDEDNPFAESTNTSLNRDRAPQKSALETGMEARLQAMGHWARRQTQQHHVPVQLSENNDVIADLQRGRLLPALVASFGDEEARELLMPFVINDDLSSIERISAALQVAEQRFGIPQLLDAELTSTTPDKISALTYLSLLKICADKREQLFSVSQDDALGNALLRAQEEALAKSPSPSTPPEVREERRQRQLELEQKKQEMEELEKRLKERERTMAEQWRQINHLQDQLLEQQKSALPEPEPEPEPKPPVAGMQMSVGPPPPPQANDCFDVLGESLQNSFSPPQSVNASARDISDMLFDNDDDDDWFTPPQTATAVTNSSINLTALTIPTKEEEELSPIMSSPEPAPMVAPEELFATNKPSTGNIPCVRFKVGQSKLQKLSPYDITVQWTGPFGGPNHARPEPVTVPTRHINSDLRVSIFVARLGLYQVRVFIGRKETKVSPFYFLMREHPQTHKVSMRWVTPDSKQANMFREVRKGRLRVSRNTSQKQIEKWRRFQAGAMAHAQREVHLARMRTDRGREEMEETMRRFKSMAKEGTMVTRLARSPFESDTRCGLSLEGSTTKNYALCWGSSKKQSLPLSALECIGLGRCHSRSRRVRKLSEPVQSLCLSLLLGGGTRKSIDIAFPIVSERNEWATGLAEITGVPVLQEDDDLLSASNTENKGKGRKPRRK
ncbi:MAG: hypothetical protein MHM6MM_000547 [Cercozoa sp. M6MM]